MLVLPMTLTPPSITAGVLFGDPKSRPGSSKGRVRKATATFDESQMTSRGGVLDDGLFNHHQRQVGSVTVEYKRSRLLRPNSVRFDLVVKLAHGSILLKVRKKDKIYFVRRLVAYALDLDPEDTEIQLQDVRSKEWLLDEGEDEDYNEVRMNLDHYDITERSILRAKVV